MLISPVRVVPRFADLSPDEVADLWCLAQRVGTKLEMHYNASSLTLAMQDGPAAGQSYQLELLSDAAKQCLTSVRLAQISGPLRLLADCLQCNS